MRMIDLNKQFDGWKKLKPYFPIRSFGMNGTSSISIIGNDTTDLKIALKTEQLGTQVINYLTEKEGRIVYEFLKDLYGGDEKTI